MDITVATFRTAFPAFADTATYPDSLVQFWLDFAQLMVNQQRWGNAYTMGVYLFAAHNIVLEGQAQITASVGGAPGLNRGVIASETPGTVSLSYDTSAGTEAGAGHWNLTIYGTRFIRMVKLFGAGPVQINTPGHNPTGLGAWPGPFGSPEASASGGYLP